MPSASLIQMQMNARITSILESPQGLKNPELARELALRTTMEADASIAILAKAGTSENPYVQAMALHGPVGIGGPHGGDISESDKERRMAEIRKNVPRVAQ